MPTAMDDLADDREVHRPTRTDARTTLGAKGLGEPPIIPTAAAVANAVANAIGVRAAPRCR